MIISNLVSKIFRKFSKIPKFQKCERERERRMRFDIPIIIFIFSILDNCVVSSKEIIGGSGKYKFRYRPDLAFITPIRSRRQFKWTRISVRRRERQFTLLHPNLLRILHMYLHDFRFHSEELNFWVRQSNGLFVCAHGLRLENSELCIANNKQRVTKTTLDGSIVWSTSFEDWNVTYPQYWQISPTDAIGVPVRARISILVSSPPTQTSIREPIRHL